MILDSQALFSDKQVITASAVSTNVVDLGAVGTPIRGNTLNRNSGFGTKIPLLVQVVSDFAGLTSLKVDLQTSATSDFATPTTEYSETLTADSLVAGARLSLPVVPYSTNQRYARLNYTVNGGTTVTGAITAGVTMGNDETLPFA